MTKDLKLVVSKLRKKKGFGPLTDGEAEVAYKAAKPVPISKARINEIVKVATSDKYQLLANGIVELCFITIEKYGRLERMKEDGKSFIGVVFPQITNVKTGKMTTIPWRLKKQVATILREKL